MPQGEPQPGPKELVGGRGVCLADLMRHKTYRLEFFQRRYVWENHQVSQMVTDLTGKFLSQWEIQHSPQQVQNYDPYFLGPFVSYRKNGDSYLADGQQRFVTVLLLLIRLQRLAFERQDDKLAMFLAPLISDLRYGVMTYAIDESDYADLFDALSNGRSFSIDGQRPHAIRAWNAYNNIADVLPDDIREDALPLFIWWLTLRVSLIEIDAGDADRAWEIFQSMNDRGVHLKPIDHLKGYFIGDALNDSQAVILEEKWQTITTRLEAIEQGSSFGYLQTVLRARYVPVTDGPQPGPSLEKATHEWAKYHEQLLVGPNKKDGDLAALIPDVFVPLAGIYDKLLRARNRLKAGLESVYFNAHNGIIEQFDLTLACIHGTDTETARTNKMRLVANFIDVLVVQHTVNNRKFDQEALNDIVSRHIVAMRSAKTVDDVKDALAKALSEENLSLDEVETLRFRDNRQAVHYILARMAAWLEVGAGKHNPIDLYLGYKRNRKQFQIEHLLSTSRAAYGISFTDDDDYQHWRSRLGALLLLDGPENAGFGAKPLWEKVDLYTSQPYLAASLSPAWSKPGFAAARRFLREQKLNKLIVAYDQNVPITSLIEQRSVLYREIARRVWSPEQLGITPSHAASVAMKSKQGNPRARRSYGVSTADLLQAGLIVQGDVLIGGKGERHYEAAIEADGRIRTTGGIFDTPSAAAMDVLTKGSWNGWDFWRLERTGEGLGDLRLKHLGQ